MVQHEGQVSWADARTGVPLEPPGEEETPRGVHPPRELLHRLLARWTVEQGVVSSQLQRQRATWSASTEQMVRGPEVTSVMSTKLPREQ